MNQCPVCSSEIQDAFGLVECPSCHKILFADFDGTLKVHDNTVEHSAVPVYEVSEEPSDADFNTNWNLIREKPAMVEAVEPQENLSTLEEINQFANSSDSSLEQGMLIYDLTIKNIDTEELKDEILAVLKENKLGIDTQKLKFSLPTLELKELNPIKVSVIVSKIKHLPVDLEWVQRSAIADKEGVID